MKTRILISLCIFFLAFINTLLSQTIEVTYTFNKPVLITNDKGYTEVIFQNAPNFNEEGKPLIPHFTAEVLLPQNTNLTGVQIVSMRHSEIAEDIILQPASKSFPISKGIPEDYQVPFHSELYSYEQAYPELSVNNIVTQYLSGHSIGLFTFCPLIYYPAGKKVQWLEEITFLLEYNYTEPGLQIQKNLRTSHTIRNRIRGIVDNPDALQSYHYHNGRVLIENDILLITANNLKSAFNDYAVFKRSTGFIVKVLGVESIYSGYTGADEQEKIRNCIISHYQNYGTSYVILGGDSDPVDPNQDIIPHRGLYVNDGTWSDADIPSDMYYACLDGNWNNNDNNKWGEPGEYDIYAEVAVGRLCVDNATEIANITNKLIFYQNAPVKPDIQKALMLGEYLGLGSYGGDCKDQITNGSSAHGFTTEGLPVYFSVNTLFDRDYDWYNMDVFQHFNLTGINLLNHLGHAHVTSNMKIGNSQINLSNFQNDGISRGYVIGYSQGCYSGSFDNRDANGTYLSSDCFAENITTFSRGEVAMVANSRYGFYAYNNTNSSSQYLDRQFFDAICGEGITAIGNTINDAREDNAGFMNSWGQMRWVIYGSNLLGDPSMDIWTKLPVDILATYPLCVPIGISQISFQTDAPAARIGLQQNGEIIGRGITDESGFLLLELFNPLSQMDEIDLSIIAHNRNRYSSTICVSEDGPFVVYYNHNYYEQDGNGNGLLDYGETVSLSLSMKNIGSEFAENVNVKLSIADFTQTINLTDNLEYYGDFQPEQVITIDDGFSFEIEELVMDQHYFRFMIKAEGDTTWTSFLSAEVNAPVLKLDKVKFQDLFTGNGNGIPEPGETGKLMLYAKNTGHAASSEVIVSLGSSFPYLTIIEDVVNVGIINPDSSVIADFTIIIDDWIPVTGAFADFNCYISADPYQSDSVFSLKIGRVIEDWETAGFFVFDWEHTGDNNWYISMLDPYEGQYCTRSGKIGNLETSGLKLSAEVTHTDSISFYYKVSTEIEKDFLIFTIDDETRGCWSGESEWKRFGCLVNEGEHTFQWTFEKDSSGSSGQDRVFVDYINLPVSEDFFVGDEFPLHKPQTNQVIIYPNPFSDYVNIMFTQEIHCEISIEIYDMHGRKIYTVADEHISEGEKCHTWGGITDYGAKAPPGIYYVNVVAGNTNYSGKIILIK